MVGAVSSALASASAVRLRAMLTNMPPCVLAADICVLFMGEGVVVYACCCLLVGRYEGENLP